MNTQKIISMVSLLSVMALSSGCTTLGFAVGAGAKTGVEAAKEGGLPRAASDFKIHAQINHLWFKENVNLFKKLDLTVNQGRVLVTGVVQNSQHRVDAVRLAWQPRGVKQVINEVRVAESEGIPGYARDLWITAQLRTKLTLDKEVQSINYSIDTVQGAVYFMGVSQNQNELNKVIDQARTVSGVKEVISYVKFAGQPLTQDTLNASSAPQYGDYNRYPPVGQSPQNNIGQPMDPYAPHRIEPAAGNTYDDQSDTRRYPESISAPPVSRVVLPEPYVQTGDLPPRGEFLESSSYPSRPSTGLKESVQVYPLNN